MRKKEGRRWTTPEEIVAKLRRRWERGDFLANTLADSDSLFPLRMSIQCPSSREMASEFSAVSEWVALWRDETRMTCEWKRVVHRLLGENKIPSAVMVPNLEALVKLLDVATDWDRFRLVVDQTASSFPLLLSWLRRRPMDALSKAEKWGQILAVVSWVCQNPRSGKYLRQVDIPGVNTKFIETHLSTIDELLSLCLPGIEAVDANGVLGFNHRYGFRSKPERIRFRFLDRASAVMPERFGLDLTVEASVFASLDPSVRLVFIIENEINFLAFPEWPQSLAIFGKGYGWSALAGADWLHRREVYYWGDLDTHGFAILDQLRHYLPHAKSFLMDCATLEALRDFWGTEPSPVRRPLPRLTEEESQVLQQLQASRQPSCRLEQEHIPFSRVKAALKLL